MNPLMRILYRIYRIASGLRYWATRRFTRAGLGVLGGLMVAATMTPDVENNVAYQAFAVLSCLLLVSFLFTPLFRGRFAVERRLPRFGTVGSPLAYSVRVTNLTSRPQGGLTLLETLADRSPSYRDWKAAQLSDEQRFRSFRVSQGKRTRPFKLAVFRDAPVPVIPPHQEAEVRVELTPLRRGALRLAGSVVARADPLGLYRAFHKVPLPQTLLILPRRYPLPPISLPGTMKYQEGGVALSSNVGQSDEFVALRDYRAGDPLRHIHWRSWARIGKPVVKEFEDEFFVRHALVLDTFTRMAYGELFEEAVSVASSFACTLLTQESLLDLLFVGTQSYCFTGGRGLAHTDQMLEILASVRPCHDQPFTTLETLVLNHADVVSGCICVLLAWDEPRRKFVEKLRMMGVPVMVIVLVESGRTRTLDPGPMQADPERFHVMEVGAVEQGLAKLR